MNAPERDQIADVERLTAVMTRIARHREWFVDEAMTAAEYADVDKATKLMHAANEFDRMYESLRARRARLEQ